MSTHAASNVLSPNVLAYSTQPPVLGRAGAPLDGAGDSERLDAATNAIVGFLGAAAKQLLPGDAAVVGAYGADEIRNTVAYGVLFPQPGEYAPTRSGMPDGGRTPQGDIAASLDLGEVPGLPKHLFLQVHRFPKDLLAFAIYALGPEYRRSTSLVHQLINAASVRGTRPALQILPPHDQPYMPTAILDRRSTMRRTATATVRGGGISEALTGLQREHGLRAAHFRPVSGGDGAAYAVAEIEEPRSGLGYVVSVRATSLADSEQLAFTVDDGGNLRAVHAGSERPASIRRVGIDALPAQEIDGTLTPCDRVSSVFIGKDLAPARKLEADVMPVLRRAITRTVVSQPPA